MLTYLNENRKMIENVYYSIRQEELETYIKKVVGMYALQIIEIQTKDMDVDELAKKQWRIFIIMHSLALRCSG